jgi:nickel-dependent lactate racemase
MCARNKFIKDYVEGKLPQMEILYGRDKIKIELPPGMDVTVIRKPSMPVLPDPKQAVLNALENPVDNGKNPQSLAQLARNASSACIVICDITRPVPNALFLRPVIETLMSHGIPPQSICILVATGLHRPNLEKELEELIGDPWVLQTVNVINHDARNDAHHRDFGKTASRGTPVKLNRHLVDADLRIVTGLVEPHFMAGYSGGRKVIAPGVAHADTITTFHNHAFMSHPAAVNCNLKSNPLHETQLEIVEMIGGAFAINTVIDEDRNLSMINFGEINASHQQAVEFIQDYCRVPVDDLFDVVITSGAGYPLDKTYYQAVKGMVGAMDILKPGGDLIIAAQCSEGLGSPEYVDAQQRFTQLGATAFLESLKPKQFADIDEWQTQMQIKAMAIGKIHLYSELSDESLKITGVQPVNDLNAFIKNMAASHPRVAVIPEGPYVIPYRNQPARVPS